MYTKKINQYVAILCLYPNFLVSSTLYTSLNLIREKLIELYKKTTIDVTVDSSSIFEYIFKILK